MDFLEKLSIKDISEFIGGKFIGTDCYIDKITTDSRVVDGKSMFVAIKGEKADGNDYAADFLNKGGICAVVEKEIEIPKGKSVILVNDTKKALRDIAEYYRKQLDVEIVGVTGSVGKTSTKDMLMSVLSCGFKTFATKGNFNNEIGVPLTIFELDSSYEKAVIEMGMSNFGEISRLTKIVKPSVAVITNIGTAHIGNLGSRENILRAKLEIVEGLKENGVLIVNGDDELLANAGKYTNGKIIYYGVDNKNDDLYAYDIVSNDKGSVFKVKIKKVSYEFKINVVGRHHIYNALAAIACGIYFGMAPGDMIKGVAEFAPSGMRQREIDINGIKIIEDCYNASTSSMESSLCVLKEISKNNRSIAVLGDVLEQGEFAEKNHREIGKYVLKFGINTLVTVGKDALYIADEAKKEGNKNVFSFSDNKSAAEFLSSYLKSNDTVLFKASRGMKFEQISEQLQLLLKGRNTE